MHTFVPNCNVPMNTKPPDIMAIVDMDEMNATAFVFGTNVEEMEGMVEETPEMLQG